MTRLAAVMVFTGCAHDVVARFPLAAPGDTGAISVTELAQHPLGSHVK